MADSSEVPKKIITPEDRAKILSANKANIVKKVLAGKTLSTKELNIVSHDDMEEDWVSGRTALAGRLGLHPNSIPRIVRAYKEHPDLPTPRANGAHCVSAWRDFMEAHGIKSGSLGDVHTSGEDLTRREQIEVQKLRRLRIENDIREGAYVKKEEHLGFFREYSEHIKARCRVIEDELPPILAGLNPGAIRVQLKQWNDRLCAEMQDYANRIEKQSRQPDGSTSAAGQTQTPPAKP
jgi:hypothetical protein